MITEHQMPTMEIKAVDATSLPEKRGRSRGGFRWWESHPLAKLFQTGSSHYAGKRISLSAAAKRLRRNKCAKQARKAHRFG